jgi:hypothetical protein
VRLPDQNSPLRLLAAFGLLCAAMPLQAAPVVPAATPATAATNAASAVAPAAVSSITATNVEKMDLPVPVGEPIKGIKIPQYDEHGKLTMNLIADTALKLDERQVEFTNLKIQFSDKEEKEIVVEIPHSILDLETKILSANTKTVIRREDFDIVGEKAEFDTMARTGKFNGSVHASFRNTSTTDQP